MEASVSLTAATAEASASARQVAQAFDEAFRDLTARLPAFERLRAIGCQLALMHPHVGERAAGRGSYWKERSCYLIQAALPYAAWAAGDWSARARLVAGALVSAVHRLPKTRFTERERAHLRDAATTAADRLMLRAPPTVEPVRPVRMRPGAAGGAPEIYFDASAAPADSIELHPSDTPRLGTGTTAPSDPNRHIFKLYRHLGAAIEYREAWVTDGAVVEHCGVCGERGEVRRHPAASQEEGRRTLASLKAAAEEGFHPLPPSRHRTLVVEFELTDGGDAALGRRHALEDFLNEETGWTGLGHCDGGSIGSGTMEVFCRVVDYELAVQVLTPILEASPFSDFSRIYRLP